MTKRFEVGGTYGAYDTAVPPITILKRTAKMVTVKNDCTTWRMKIRVSEADGAEYVTDSSVPDIWQDCYTYSAKFKEG